MTQVMGSSVLNLVPIHDLVIHRIVANKSMQKKHWPLPEHWKNTQNPTFSMSNTILQHEDLI